MPRTIVCRSSQNESKERKRKGRRELVQEKKKKISRRSSKCHVLLIPVNEHCTKTEDENDQQNIRRVSWVRRPEWSSPKWRLAKWCLNWNSINIDERSIRRERSIVESRHYDLDLLCNGKREEENEDGAADRQTPTVDHHVPVYASDSSHLEDRHFLLLRFWFELATILGRLGPWRTVVRIRGSTRQGVDFERSSWNVLPSLSIPRDESMCPSLLRRD